jgi:hypothetical protein
MTGFPFGSPDNLREDVSGFRLIKGSDLTWFAPKSEIGWETCVFDSKTALP